MNTDWAAFEKLRDAKNTAAQTKDAADKIEKSTDLKNIIQSLVKIREAAKISQRAMRIKTGVGLNSINNFETLTAGRNDVFLIEKYMHALDLSFNKKKGCFEKNRHEKQVSRQREKQE